MATIKDVAERAGVSTSTVSYVLSGKRSISEPVKARVRQAIAELEFAPNLLGRNLRQGSSDTVGMAYPLSDVRLEFVQAAAEVLQERFTLSLLTQVQEPQQLIDAFKRRRMDGLILMQIREHDERVERLRASPYPFALIGRPQNTEGLSFVEFDFETAAFLAVAHLVKLGHEQLGYITYPRSKRALNLAHLVQLERGYTRAREHFGVSVIAEEAQTTALAAAQATTKLMRQRPEPTALIALDSSAYSGVLRALYDLGKRVPEDCSVVSFTTRDAAEWTVPRLTSIKLPYVEMGRLGAELIAKQLSGDTYPQHIMLPATLEVRESTAPPRRS